MAAAQRLFADNGFSSTSLRQITSAAGVNLAAVNYHFRSKEALAREVLRRTLEPINEERLRRLDLLEASTAGAPQLERVLDCFIRPVFELRQRQSMADFPRFMARLLTEPGDWVMEILRSALAPLMGRFVAALERALPGANPEDTCWGICFGIGSFLHTLANPHAFAIVASLHGYRLNEEDAADRLVGFFASGLRGLANAEREGGARK